MQPVYLRAARNFGLTQFNFFSRVILPATLPQIITASALPWGGVLVVVARK